MVIDFHAHIFPDALAPRALASLSDNSGLLPCADGTLGGTLEKARGWGVDRFVFANIATNPKQQTNVNSFAISLCEQGQYAFGSVHPNSANAPDELERLAESGVRGIKLHSEYQEFVVDEPRMFPIYEKTRELGLIILFHSGQDLGFMGCCRCPAARLRKVVTRFDGLTVVAAHMGGWLEYGETLRQLAGLPVYLDTSFSYGYVYPELGKRLVDAFGADRILFGSDAPWMSPAVSLDFVRSLGLSAAEMDMVLYKNALNLLHKGV